MGIVFSYYNSLFNEFWIIEYQIAETKAGYMADTGIAKSTDIVTIIFLNYYNNYFLSDFSVTLWRSSFTITEL